MQRNSRLYLAGFSMTIKALAGFAAFVIVDLMTLNVVTASLCLLGANLVFIVLFDIPKVRRLEKTGSLFSGNLKPSLVLLRASVYIFAFAFLTHLLPNIPRYFMDIYHSEKLLSFFAYVIMPATMMNLFVQFVIQPKLLPLSERFAAAEYKSFNRTTTKLILVSLVFGIAAIFAAWLVGIPVLSFIFGEDLAPYRIALTLAVLGGTVNTVTMIYSNVLTIMRSFKIQLFNYLITTAGVFASSMTFISGGGLGGAVQAFLIANVVQAALFVVTYQIVFRRICKPVNAAKR
jgi:O-antigen/teichoic acid export membrane protein